MLEGLLIGNVLGVVIGAILMHRWLMRRVDVKMVVEADALCSRQADQIKALRKELSLMSYRLSALNGMVDAHPYGRVAFG